MSDLYNCRCSECGIDFLSDTLKTVCPVCIPDKRELFNLRAENERLREALEEVRPLVFNANHSAARYPKARTALKGKP